MKQACDDCKTWTEATEEIVSKFQVAGTFNGNTVFNSDGSKAAASLIAAMARKLDKAVELQGDYNRAALWSGYCCALSALVGFLVGRFG